MARRNSNAGGNPRHKHGISRRGQKRGSYATLRKSRTAETYDRPAIDRHNA